MQKKKDAEAVMSLGVVCCGCSVDERRDGRGDGRVWWGSLSSPRPSRENQVNPVGCTQNEGAKRGARAKMNQALEEDVSRRWSSASIPLPLKGGGRSVRAKPSRLRA